MDRTNLTIIRSRNGSIYGLTVAMLWLMAAIVPSRAADATRITTSVEIKHVQPLLRRVAHVMDQGFTRTEADKLAAEIRAMPAEQPKSWSYQVRYEGGMYPLEIRALLDELGTVDLDFATSPALARALRTDLDAYLNSHNL